MNARQTTIARPAEFSGIALHSGRAARVRLSPREENGGLLFYRTDLRRGVRASINNVRDSRLATTLADGDCAVGTVEHLLSALSALQIDNLQVDVDGPELPILDGSAAPWLLFLTDACGIAAQNALRKIVRVLKTVERRIGDARARFRPSEDGMSRYDVRIDFPHAAVRRTGGQCAHLLSQKEYEEEISRARTFCYVGDVERMRRGRRALGGSLDCAVVYDDAGVLNAEGLRYADEFARHKVLDAIGDCYVDGRQIVARYEAERPGHALNHALVAALLADKTAWESA